MAADQAGDPQPVRQAADIVPREYQAALFEEAKAGNVRDLLITSDLDSQTAATVVHRARWLSGRPRPTATHQRLGTATTSAVLISSLIRKREHSCWRAG